MDIENAVGQDRLAQARSAHLILNTGSPLNDRRISAIAYYEGGELAPYEESFSLGDAKDVRFASVSFWRNDGSNVGLTL